MAKNNKALDYAFSVIDGKAKAPKYVKLQCEEFIRIANDQSESSFFDERLFSNFCKILRMLQMARGPKAGKSIYGALTGYQWLLIAALCVKIRKDPNARRYKRILLEIARKNGKAISLDTPIPTPDGWKTMGDIHEGDYVFSCDGTQTKVTYESPIFMKPMYAVEFEDGEIIKASCDHLWTVKSKKSKRTMDYGAKKRIGDGKRYRDGGWYEATTEEIAQRFKRVRKDKKGIDYLYRVPMQDPVQYQEKDLPIDPYLLGVWLGDGTSNNQEITVSYDDLKETYENLSDCGYDLLIWENKNRAPSIKIDWHGRGVGFSKPGDFRYELKKLNLINNKHIPDIYLQSSIHQRMELLRGLMDTDGTCSKRGQCEFCQKDKKLIDQVAELLASLGIKTNVKYKEAKCGSKICDAYRLHFFVDKKHSCFKLKRKHERLKDELGDRMNAKSIIDVRPIETEPSKCIMVNHPSHLYLCGKKYTTTHNTLIVAVLFIILFYTEPEYSKFFSVAPNGQLAREIKEAIDPLLSVNKKVFETSEWKATRDYILHRTNNIKYEPLNFSTSTMDGREPTVFIVDEAGALPTNYPIEAMKTGQIMVKNPVGFIISTKYPEFDNPLEDEVANAKRVLDGIKKDDSLFALLYEPDTVDDWQDNDDVLAHANPMALDYEPLWDELIRARSEAIERSALRQNFLTKNCNIMYQGLGTESYVDVADVQKCKVDHIDWDGRDVFVAVDLSMSSDNTSVAMATMDNGVIYAHVMAFIPEGRIDLKNKEEKLDYRKFINAGHCIACGDMSIDYSVVEDYVFNIEKMFGVTVRQIGFDRWNAMSSAQKWDEQYETIEIKQHSSVLHPATKLLYEKIVNGEFAYEENPLLEINFQNAVCAFDTNMNRYVHKRKSRGKVDMVVSLINAVHLVQTDALDNTGFIAMVL